MSATSSALFRAGFRPFFLGAGLIASATVLLWPHVLAGRVATPGGWPPLFWHGHELIFGLAAAAIAGFLLTAVPNWTDTKRLSGRPLVLLAAAWLAGRIAVWSASAWPPAVVATLDLVFLPLLAGAVGAPILRARMPRNYPVVAILLALALCNLAVHGQLIGLSAATARPALLAAVYLVIVLIAIISGRIVPLFTRNYLKQREDDAAIDPQPRLETALIPLLLVAAGFAVAREESPLGGAVQIAAALLLLRRQLAWRASATRDQPILWILHVGHAWLVLGFGLLGLAAWLPGLPASAGFHALTAGAMGTMILGVMSRVALGHTGRDIVAGRTTVVAYALVGVGGVLRVTAPILGGPAQPGLLDAAGTVWALGYLLFCVTYAPILLRPRVDGKPG